MRRSFVAGVASAFAVACAVACGIDAVGTGEAASGGGASSSSSSGSSTSSGGASSSGNGTSSSGGPAPGCVASGPEVCDDGLDNDCNGKIDCEDPACGAWACAKKETGFTIVSVRAAGASDAGAGADAGTCAPGWTNPRVLVDNIRSAAPACACTCGAANGNACANAGTRNVLFRTGTSSCNDGSMAISVDDACHALPSSWDSNYNGAGMNTFPIAQVSCGATAALPAVVDDGTLLLCDAAISAAAVACTGGTCVQKPDTDDICLWHDGDATCPAAFPTKKTLAPSFTDTRACGACSCQTNTTACADRQIAFYTNAGCNQGLRAAAVNGSCNDLSGSGTPTHYRYEATPNGACVAAAATVAFTGAVDLATPSTLCCPQ